MARTNRRRQNTQRSRRTSRRTKVRFIRRRRPARNGVTNYRPQASAPLGQAIARGVRTIASYLPFNNIINPICDVLFQVFGLAKVTFKKDENKVTKVSTYRVSVDSAVIGAQSCFYLNYVNILTGSRLGARGADSNTPSGASLIIDYTEARLLSFSINLTPSNITSKRSGKVYLVFVPFYSESDVNYYKTEYSHRADPKELFRSPHCVIGMANQPLTLTFRPKVSDGYIYQWHGLSDPFGMVVIHYEDLARSVYSDLTGEDFGVNIVCEGRVAVRATPASVGSEFTLTDKVIDLKSLSGEYCLRVGDSDMQDLRNVVMEYNHQRACITAKLDSGWFIDRKKDRVVFTKTYTVHDNVFSSADDFVEIEMSE